jgi:hypothetical protein
MHCHRTDNLHLTVTCSEGEARDKTFLPDLPNATSDPTTFLAWAERSVTRGKSRQPVASSWLGYDWLTS